MYTAFFLNLLSTLISEDLVKLCTLKLNQFFTNMVCRSKAKLVFRSQSLSLQETKIQYGLNGRG